MFYAVMEMLWLQQIRVIKQCHNQAGSKNVTIRDLHAYPLPKIQMQKFFEYCLKFELKYKFF